MNEIYGFLNKLAATEDMTLGQFLMNVEHDLQEDGDTGVSLNKTTVREYIKDLDSLGSEDTDSGQDKIANEIYSFLEKTATSFDARRNKQYWQMLKRMYGGTDEAVAAIKESGDTGIWHGTRSELADKIEQEGLQVGPFREFGKGTFFGDKETAKMYSRRKILNVDSDNFNYEVGGMTFEEALAKPHLYKISEGELFRLAKPSELTGTKTLYPNADRAKVFNTQKYHTSEREGLSIVAPSQTEAFLDNDETVLKSLKNFKTKALSLDNPNDVESVFGPSVLESINRNQHILNRTESQVSELYEKRLNKIKEMVANKDERGIELELSKFEDAFKRGSRDRLLGPLSEEERRQLDAYGKLKGVRVFDRAGTPNRNEFFIDETEIYPNMLRRENLKQEDIPIKTSQGEKTETDKSLRNSALAGFGAGIPLGIVLNNILSKRKDDRNGSNL